MKTKTIATISSLLFLAACSSMPTSGPLIFVSEQKWTGFTFPESVGCDYDQEVLYVSQFGGKELKPAEKDGLGYISKVSPDGKILEQRAFDVKMDKPKGIWVASGRLWVTDIDGVWIFDTKTKQGRKLPIPGAQFANDPAVQGGALYVSDNRSDQLFKVEPADFLDAKVQPKVSVVFSKKDINPNGVWPGRDGNLYVGGFLSPDKPRGIYIVGKDGGLTPVTDKPIGRVDGLYQSVDGSFIATDWNSGSLFQWSKERGMETLAKGFKGPADFCVFGYTIIVPDLVASEVRAITLRR